MKLSPAENVNPEIRISSTGSKTLKDFSTSTKTTFRIQKNGTTKRLAVKITFRGKIHTKNRIDIYVLDRKSIVRYDFFSTSKNYNT